MRTIVILLALVPCVCSGQWGVSYHQSNLPFVGINYQATNRIRPEVRIGTDQYFDNIALEAVVTYDLVKHNDYEIYAGLGARTETFSGLVIPVGLNIYPLPYKQFGFHIEVSPIINESQILRASWGIRYRFLKGK